MARQIPLEDFFRNSCRSAYQISPDGLHLSYLAPYKNRMNIFVEPVGGGEPLRLTSETLRSIAGYTWKGNSRIVFIKDIAGDENYKLFGVDIDGSGLTAYTDFPGVRTSIIDSLEDYPDEILIAMNRRAPECFDPYRLNMKTGEMTMLCENPGNYQDWLTDHDGRLRSAVAIVDGVNTQILYRDTEEEAFRPVMTTNFRNVINFMGFTPDNRNVYAATNLGRDKIALCLMDPATCKEIEQLYEHPDYDISNITYSRRRKKLLGVFCSGHKEPVRHYFDAEESAFRKKLSRHFPDNHFGMADCDRSETRFIIYSGGDRTRGAYYYYDLQTDFLRKLCDLAPWLNKEELAEMRPVIYTARDGLKIEAYLSLPASHGTKGSLPMIIYPHGGPWTRDSWGYDSVVQFFCSRGYGVFQMNFRGSTGYGRRFMEASYKEWGRRMQDDITDGTKWLIRKGYADADRIAIYGGSYGGYAVLAGLCFTPKRYACGIDYVGVSNLLTFLNTIPPYWRPMLEIMYERIGNPDTEREYLEAVSPALHAECICRPLLIAQGANDPRVNRAESDQMVDALRRRGVEVEYIVKENEGHGFANEENRFDFFRRVEIFLERHLKDSKS